MELKEQPAAPTLARKLGDTTHVSALLRKVCHLSGLPPGEVGQWLLKCAIERGARHYVCDFPATLPRDRPELSDEEVAVGLCLGHHLYNAFYLRAAAQLLSSPRVDAQLLARLAEMERVEPVLLHIAAACQRVDNELQPWATLRRVLHPRRTVRTDALPHWTRFAILPGLTREGYAPPQWLWRRE